MKYNVKIVRTYTTWVLVEADSKEQAETINDALIEALNVEELAQCDSEITETTAFIFNKP